MKKKISVLLIFVFLLTLCLPVLAMDDTRSTNLKFNYVPAEPGFMVTIPGTWDVVWDDNLSYNYMADHPHPIEVSDMKNMKGKSVVISIAGTQDCDPGCGDGMPLKLKIEDSAASDDYLYECFYMLQNFTLGIAYYNSGYYDHENRYHFRRHRCVLYRT